MKGNINNPSGLKFIAVAPTVYQILAGANAWIDTDASALVGTGRTNKVWFFQVKTSAAINVGVFPQGDTETGVVGVSSTVNLLSEASSTGHFSLLRQAGGNADYIILGYLTNG